MIVVGRHLETTSPLLSLLEYGRRSNATAVCLIGSRSFLVDFPQPGDAHSEDFSSRNCRFRFTSCPAPWAATAAFTRLAEIGCSWT